VLKDWGIQPAPAPAVDNPPGPHREDRRPEAGGEAPAAPGLVGKWSGTFTFDGQRLTSYTVLKADGTTAFAVTNAAGQIVNQDSGRYTYANGIMSTQYVSGAWEKAAVTWVNPNQAIYKINACSNPAVVGMQITFRRLAQ
jgi:hypothetical protein